MYIAEVFCLQTLSIEGNNINFFYWFLDILHNLNFPFWFSCCKKTQKDLQAYYFLGLLSLHFLDTHSSEKVLMFNNVQPCPDQIQIPTGSVPVL